MKVSTQKLPHSQVELRIEVPAEELKTFYDKTLSQMGKEVQVEGFRKGNAPKEIVEKKVGQQNVLAEAAESCIRENYLKAVKEKGIEPLGQPKIEILKMALGNPLEFKATVSIMPEIKMPDYRKIASSVKKREVKVTDEEIAKLKEEKEKARTESLAKWLKK